jgi:beta-carotene 3-hydroxylase
VIDPFLAMLVAFVVMEPATVVRTVERPADAVHHPAVGGIRRRVTRSWKDRWEANDWFPVMFAGVTIVAMAAGTTDSSLAVLVPVAIGVTIYGAAYAFVHDVYIHGRFARMPVFAPLERLRWAHGVHHLYGAEPYGMLCPIVPRALRERSRTTAIEPLAPRATVS